MGRLSGHPHIVTVHDVGEDEGQPYIVSEYMRGGDVEALLADAAECRVHVNQPRSVRAAGRPAVRSGTCAGDQPPRAPMPGR